jgi:hypothetical protein
MAAPTTPAPRRTGARSEPSEWATARPNTHRALRSSPSPHVGSRSSRRPDISGVVELDEVVLPPALPADVVGARGSSSIVSGPQQGHANLFASFLVAQALLLAVAARRPGSAHSRPLPCERGARRDNRFVSVRPSRSPALRSGRSHGRAQCRAGGVADRHRVPVGDQGSRARKPPDGDARRRSRLRACRQPRPGEDVAPGRAVETMLSST